MKHEVHFSSATPEWATPQDLFDRLNSEFKFTLDPCCTHENAKCKKHYTKAEDGLSKDWTGEVVFMNPPYGREIGRWIAKARNESAKFRGATVVALVPARTDTAWWHDYVLPYEVRFIRGRIKFVGGKHSNHVRHHSKTQKDHDATVPGPHGLARVRQAHWIVRATGPLPLQATHQGIVY
jgi:phage N-6-adenine-methyltransferase